MEFRILGPLEVADGERSLSFDAPKQRALLGLLLLHPNEVVSSERVIDELWGERPPATANKLVQTYVSQLRKTLGPDLITTRSPGYTLLLPEHAIDAARFRRLASEARGSAANGDRQQADVLYREALALWRGPPLADVAFESFARNEVERLEEERLDAISARVDCELALGQHESLVSELETLVREYPLRERLRAQLMLALYRCGRQAEALEIFRNGHRILADQLGLEPSRELQELERAILTHDPALDSPPPTEPVSIDGVQKKHPRRAVLHPLWRRLALLAGALLVVLVAVGLALAFGRGHAASLRLPPSSIGFVDAGSGRITRVFPVGRAPDSITVTNDSVWVANYDSETVTRINRATGHGETIGVDGHPSGIAASRGSIWVWTLEGLLVRVDPRYDSADPPVRLASAGRAARAPGRITAGGGFLWITAPSTTVLRVAPGDLERRRNIVSAWGAGGPVVDGRGAAWIAGSSYTGYVFPIRNRTGVPGSGIAVGGPVRDLALQGNSLWVLSGGSAGPLPHQALRDVDLHDQLVRTTVAVGDDPVAVVDAAGSIWVADRGDGTILRVDPSDGGHVVDTIKVGASPTALAADRRGIWVTTS